MATPDEVTGGSTLDVGKDTHYADVLDDGGDELFVGPVGNDEAAIDGVLERASGHGMAGLVIDQPGSIAQLAIAVAARRDAPDAYVPGLVMRRTADLFPGEAKTDRRDAFVITDTGRTRRRQVHWLDTASDDLLAQRTRRPPPLAGSPGPARVEQPRRAGGRRAQQHTPTPWAVPCTSAGARIGRRRRTSDVDEPARQVAPRPPGAYCTCRAGIATAPNRLGTLLLWVRGFAPSGL